MIKQGRAGLVLGLLVIAALAGCTSASVPSRSTPLAVLQLGEQDGGGTVQAHVGQVVELDLGEGYSAVHSSDSSVLQEQAAAGSCSEVAGCQRYTFLAKASGEADLMAERRAVCTPGDMCPMFIFLFTIHVQVANP